MEPWYGKEEKRAILDYLSTGGWLMEFKKTEEFEQAICDFTGAKYCSVLPNGTISLSLAMLAVGIGPGDEVIVPDYTMIATPNAVRLIGAKPVLVDVDESLCLDPKLVSRAITKKTKGVMHVSINGRAGKLQELKELCKKKNILLLEDAAQSLGSFYKGKHLGRHGVIGSFSFSVPKIITTGQGGALITDDSKLYGKIEKLKDFGRVAPGKDVHDALGWNFKFTDLQAVLGLAQIRKLENRVERKKRMYAQYQKFLKGVPQIRFIPTNIKEVSPWFMEIMVPDPAALATYLKEQGIGSRAFYPAIHTQKVYSHIKGTFPVATETGKHGLWLPSSSFLTQAEIKKICLAVKNFFEA